MNLNSKFDFSTEAAVVLVAASQWIHEIQDHPNLWASEGDLELIRAIRKWMPNVHCKWLNKPEYEGWTDTTHPDYIEE